MVDDARRIDLRLRSKYPYLNTSLYKINQYCYLIYVENFDGDFAKLSEEFNNSIRTLGMNVQLVPSAPEEFLKKIEGIKDEEIGDNYSGLPLTQGDMLNLLTAKFPKIPVRFVKGVQKDFPLRVFTDSLTLEHHQELSEFIEGLNMICKFEIIADSTTSEKIIEEHEENTERIKKNTRPEHSHLFIPNPVVELFPTKTEKVVLDIEKEDEGFWFDNVGKIYRNEITRNDIYSVNENEFSCYIDYSSFINTNIRNGLLLYDKVYVELPFDRNIKHFRNMQEVSEDELEKLISENRIIFVLTQPTSRYDYEFLKNSCSINKNSVLTRRRLVSLLLADLVEIYNGFFVNQLGCHEKIQDLSKMAGTQGSIGSDLLYNVLSWPYSVLRSSFDVMTFNSSKRIGSIGVNNVISAPFERIIQKDCSLEFMTCAENVHISHALGAVYYPSYSDSGYSNKPFSSLMGNLLNFYSNASIESIADYASIKQGLLKCENELSPLDIFETDEYLPVGELESFAKQFETSGNLNSIHSYLASFSDEERNAKIEGYNSELNLLRTSSKSSKSHLDLGVTAALDLAGYWLPGLGLGKWALQKGKGKLSQNSAIKEFLSELQKKQKEKNPDKYNIKFLHKINSVARLKKKY